jgi:hypothetical protein
VLLAFDFDIPFFEMVAGIVAGAAITYVAVRYQAGAEQRKDDAAKAAEAARAASTRERADTERANSPHWTNATRLLKNTVFKQVPNAVADPTIEKVLEHFERRGTGLGNGLFRAARLFVEARVFGAASGDTLEPLTAGNVDDAMAVLKTPLDTVYAALAQPPMRTFGTCFELAGIEDAATEPKASTYFAALTDLEDDGYTEIVAGERPGDRWRSLTRIEVQDGFVAPTYLVTGLLQEFEENWQRLLRGFGASVPQDASEFLHVQRFEFYCWLLWGPSIPACECRGWDGSFIALQYGYGDENNSFPLMLEEGLYREGWERLRKRIVANDGKPVPLAVAAALTGSLVWGPQVARGRKDVPEIYYVSADPRSGAPPGSDQSVFKGLMIRADTIQPLDAPRLYYSAYAWIMFEACKEDGTPLYRTPGERWKYLLPIFEHANLADGEALMFLKERLAEKAWSAVQDLERGGAIRLRYACALDDPGDVATDHGHHRLRFQLDEVPAVRRRRLRELLVKNVLRADGIAGIDDDTDAAVLEASIATSPRCTRLFERPTVDDEIVTACDIPEIVEGFYQSQRRERVV